MALINTDVKLVENSFNYVSVAKANTFRQSKSQKRGDIVITHRGTLGQVYIYSKEFKIRIAT